MSVLLDAALDFAERMRWPVFPLASGGKRPLIPKTDGGHGFHDATCDPEQIRRWWSRWPNANIGSPLTDDLVVLDEDQPGGLRIVAANLGPLPSTITSRTRSGGRHVVYRLDDERRLQNDFTLVEGVDSEKRGVVLYCGGKHYFVLPPSRVAPGEYSWIIAPGSPGDIAPVPDWLYQVAAERRGRDPAEWNELAGKVIHEGARNTTLASVAGLLFRQLPALLAYDLGMLWAQHRCSPPMRLDEAERTLDSIARRELERRGGDL